MPQFDQPPGLRTLCRHHAAHRQAARCRTHRALERGAIRDCMRELRLSGLQESVLEAALWCLCLHADAAGRQRRRRHRSLGSTSGEMLRLDLAGSLQHQGIRRFSRCPMCARGAMNEACIAAQFPKPHRFFCLATESQAVSLGVCVSPAMLGSAERVQTRQHATRGLGRI